MTTDPNILIATWSATVLLAGVRCTAMVMVAPVFGESVVPIRLRVAMGLVLAVALAGRALQPTAMPAHVGELLLAVACEAGIGAVLGYAARLLFVGVQVGAMHVAQQMGPGLAEVFNPAGPNAGGPVGTLLRMLAILAFLAIGGHRELVGVLMDSFRILPLRSLASPAAAMPGVVNLLGASFELGLRVAAPVLAALLLAGVAMAFVQRTLPEVHLLSTNLPVRGLVGLVVLAASLAVVPALVAGAWAYTSRQLTGLLESMVSP